ncbi:MAG: glycosyltransferase family 4 protein [Pseudomonadota bacterium]
MVAVAQIGARMHYGVPNILLRNGLLHSFHTDIVAPPPQRTKMRRVLGLSPLTRRYRGRVISDALYAKTHLNRLAALWYAYRLRQATTLSERYAVFQAQARRFGRDVLRAGISEADAVYTFTSASLELLDFTRAHGIHAFLEQFIASQPMRDALLAEERLRFADWEPISDTAIDVPDYEERVRSEWEGADTIVCPSAYVADSLREEHVDAKKLVIVPYGVVLPDRAPSAVERPPNRPLRILFVGSVELRKGIHYLTDALAMLPPDAYEARIVGSLRLTRTGLGRLAEVADIVGRIPRAEIVDEFTWADVFVLPSLVEGSATVTYEALSHGVPVICTPNTGSIVRDGENGFVVEAFSAQTIADVLTRLLDEPDLLARLRSMAWDSRSEASVERYEADLVAAIRSRCSLPAFGGPDRT